MIAPHTHSSPWFNRRKDLIDGVLAAVLTVPAAPLIVLSALAVKLTSRGPVFYCQSRLGKEGRPFTLYKIRTMSVDSEQGGPRWSTPGDPRVTRVGRILRWTHLDELPQLWNVLAGEMSLVGPRPERPEFVPGLAAAIPHYRQRLAVRPGVTGLAQVQLPADTDLDSVRKKLAYDLYYVHRASLWLDLRLLLSTGFKVMGLSPSRIAQLMGLPSRSTVERSLGGMLHSNLEAQPLPYPPMVAEPQVLAAPLRIPLAKVEHA